MSDYQREVAAAALAGIIPVYVDAHEKCGGYWYTWRATCTDDGAPCSTDCQDKAYEIKIAPCSSLIVMCDRSAARLTKDISVSLERPDGPFRRCHGSKTDGMRCERTAKRPFRLLISSVGSRPGLRFHYQFQLCDLHIPALLAGIAR